MAPGFGPGTLNSLNRRFLNGVASNDFLQAGIFIHQSDDQDNAPGRWGRAWEPDSGQYSDRIAGSVLNKFLPYTFSSSAVGFVLNPLHMPDNIIRCAYPFDGNSMNTWTGCNWDHAFDRNGLMTMMQRNQGLGWCHDSCGCACCGEVTAADRNGCRYNEIVFDGDAWRSALPDLIEAVFHPINGEVHHHEGDANGAWGARDYFLQTYPRRELMVFSYDLHKAERWEPPFGESKRL